MPQTNNDDVRPGWYSEVMMKNPNDKILRAAKSKAQPVRPEAELESRLSTALGVAFKNIPREQLVEQRRFTVRLGHETEDFDSTAQWEKSGRADILIFHDDKPLAVIELKRQDLALTNADREQAQSYANQLTPRPPLVVVTNGTDTRVWNANTGEPWLGVDDAQAEVQKLLANASKLAASEMRWAIEALMGRETGVWTRAVRGCTSRLIEELTDLPGQSGRPFARELLFPRLASFWATRSLKEGPAFTIVEAPPVAGKSSLIREIAERTKDSEELAILMLRGSGPGLFRSIANMFAAELDWTLTADDARNWLRRMSKDDAGPTLVVAVDDVAPGSPMAADLEELMSLQPGPRLKILITTDRAAGLTKGPNGRTPSAVGSHAAEIALGAMGLEEFQAAAQSLEQVKIAFSDGAEHAEDYRAPWVLRAIYDSIATDPRYADPTKGPLLPPALGLEWIDTARVAYAQETGLLRGYRVLARDAIADVTATSDDLALRGSHSFIIRRDALSPEGRDELAGLVNAGWARTLRLGLCDVVIPTAPAVFMAELADVAAEILGDMAKTDAHAAGVWLAQRLDAVYLGDLVGAEAIRRYGLSRGGFSVDIIWGLLSIKPEVSVMTDGLVAFEARDGRLIHIKLEGGKAWLSDRHGNARGEPVEVEEKPGRTYGSTTGWMILAQFARLRTADALDNQARLEPTILLEIGQCPFPLVRANREVLGMMEHDLGDLGQVLCQEVAPMTSSLGSRPTRRTFSEHQRCR